MRFSSVKWEQGWYLPSPGGITPSPDVPGETEKPRSRLGDTQGVLPGGYIHHGQVPLLHWKNSTSSLFFQRCFPYSLNKCSTKVQKEKVMNVYVITHLGCVYCKVCCSVSKEAAHSRITTKSFVFHYNYWICRRKKYYWYQAHL